jgi:hypothetical protein
MVSLWRRWRCVRKHISDDAVEPYYLGMITEETELAPVEGHILARSGCASGAAAAQA